MVRQVAHWNEKDASTVVRCLGRLVTNGPRDLDIASAMSEYGYDAIKWAEGQGMVAELVDCDLPPESSLSVAIDWWLEAAMAARHALASKPQLLNKLGVAEIVPN